MAQAPAAVVVRRWTARIKRTALGRDVTPSPVGLDADDWNGRRGSWFVKRRRRCVQRGRWWSVVVNGARSVYVCAVTCHRQRSYFVAVICRPRQTFKFNETSPPRRDRDGVMQKTQLLVLLQTAATTLTIVTARRNCHHDGVECPA